jgi:hypothetical protein
LDAYDQEALLAAAGFAQDLGRNEEAIGYATRLVELEPDDPNIQRFFSQLRRWVTGVGKLLKLLAERRSPEPREDRGR